MGIYITGLQRAGKLGTITLKKKHPDRLPSY
jgi:predicted peptidase